jgi:hypothetical protein
MMESKMGMMSQLDTERRRITDVIGDLDRRDMRDKLMLAAFQGLVTNLASEPKKLAKAAAEYADAMLLEWEKRK